jgi:hypothetical protein
MRGWRGAREDFPLRQAPPATSLAPPVGDGGWACEDFPLRQAAPATSPVGDGGGSKKCMQFVGGFAGLVGFFGVHGLGAGDREELCRGHEVGLGVDELLADGQDAAHRAVGLVDPLGFEQGGEFVEVQAADIAQVEDGVGLVGEEREKFVDHFEFEVWRVAVDEG